MNNIDKIRAANARIAELEAQLAEAIQERDSAENKMQMFAELNAKAEADAARLRAALEAVEWTWKTYDGLRFCGWCLRLEDDGHSIACAWKLALAPEAGHGIDTIGDLLTLANETDREELKKIPPGMSLNDYRNEKGKEN